MQDPEPNQEKTAIPKLLTPREAAAMLRVSQRGLFNLRKRGVVRSVKVGNLTRFHTDDVIRAVTPDPVTNSTP